MACAHCGSPRAVVARGLCYRCYRDRAVRARHPVKSAPAPGSPDCPGCARPVHIYLRGLCHTCWKDPAVRAARGLPDARRRDRSGDDPGRVRREVGLVCRRVVRECAWRVASAAGRPDLADDAEQAGWLYLCSAVGGWDGRAKLLTACWRSLRGQMWRHVRKYLREHAIGAAGVDFDCPGRGGGAD